MTSLVHSITIDCRDPAALSAFWAAVTGYAEDPDDPNVAGDAEWLIRGDTGTPLLFIAVPEGKTVKNRLHLDVQPADRTRDDEVARILGLGATVVGDFRRPDGTGWVTLADPEGNELCVVRSKAERASG